MNKITQDLQNEKLFVVEDSETSKQHRIFIGAVPEGMTAHERAIEVLAEAKEIPAIAVVSDVDHEAALQAQIADQAAQIATLQARIAELEAAQPPENPAETHA